MFFNQDYEFLKDGGLFIVDMMSPESFVWLKRKGMDKISERSYSKEEIKKMLTRGGFKILNIKKQKTMEWDGKPKRGIFLVKKPVS